MTALLPANGRGHEQLWSRNRVVELKNWKTTVLLGKTVLSALSLRRLAHIQRPTFVIVDHLRHRGLCAVESSICGLLIRHQSIAVEGGLNTDLNDLLQQFGEKCRFNTGL